MKAVAAGASGPRLVHDGVRLDVEGDDVGHGCVQDAWRSAVAGEMPAVPGVPRATVPVAVGINRKVVARIRFAAERDQPT